MSREAMNLYPSAFVEMVEEDPWWALKWAAANGEKEIVLVLMLKFQDDGLGKDVLQRDDYRILKIVMARGHSDIEGFVLDKATEYGILNEMLLSLTRRLRGRYVL